MRQYPAASLTLRRAHRIRRFDRIEDLINKTGSTSQDDQQDRVAASKTPDAEGAGKP